MTCFVNLKAWGSISWVMKDSVVDLKKECKRDYMWKKSWLKNILLFEDDQNMT